MRTTIDQAGRLVVPKAIRERLGLTGGEQIEVSERNGVIHLVPACTSVRLVDRDGVLVAETEEALPDLTAETVRDTLDGVRR